MNRLSTLCLAVCTALACSSPEATDPTPSGYSRIESSLAGAQQGPQTINGKGNGNGNGGGPNKTTVKEIIVTIDKVTAHSNSAGWVTLSNNDVTIDLLKLSQEATSLGLTQLPQGKITQIRLYVKEGGTQYVTRDDGMKIDLKVPSGIQSGIKLKGLFDLKGCELTSLPIELDGKHSIWVHPNGQGDLWLLRPVIRLGKVTASSIGCTPDGEDGPGDPTPGLDGGSTIPNGNPNPNPMTPPPPGVTGTICTEAGMCLSGMCTGGKCAPGGADAPCTTGADCTTGTCNNGTCSIGPTTGAGGACAANTQCLSGSCSSGICDPGGQGQPCRSTADCAEMYSCVDGSCDFMPN